MATPAVDERDQAAVTAVLNLIRQLSEASAGGQPVTRATTPQGPSELAFRIRPPQAVVHNERQRSDTRSQRYALR
jgi:hypothetical protein